MSTTTVYFVRHAEADNSVADDRNRPLTEKGRADCALVTEYLRDKNIEIVLSSPYRRAADTISDFARSVNIPIETVEDFREFKLCEVWLDDFMAISERQWADFTYRLPDGECLRDVQVRNVAALSDALKRYEGKNIVIGTHGTALAVTINYFDSSFGFDDFMAMVYTRPWIVRMEFISSAGASGASCAGIEKISLY